MRAHQVRPPAMLLGCLTATLMVVGCSGDSASAPLEDLISMCHVVGATGSVISVPSSQLAAHRSQGDYPTQLSVSATASAVQDSVHFTRIGDALAVARAGRLARSELTSAACPITISVAAGLVRGDAAPNADPTLEHFPIIIDVPAIAVVGAMKMQVDASGRALGTAEGAIATTMSPINPLPIVGGTSSQTGASVPIFMVNGHPGGSAGNEVTIQGFILRSGHEGIDTIPGGQGVQSMRVSGLAVRGNKFEAFFTEAIDLRASSATVDVNHLSGSSGACDLCVAGPGDYKITGNRLLAGGIPGILIVPALILPVVSDVEQFTLPTASTVTASVSNNEVRDHLRKPVGVGVRVGAVGIGAPNVAGHSVVTIANNALTNNNFAIILDAAFPVATSTLRGDIDVTLSQNVLQLSCQVDLLVSFSRHTTALGLANAAYLKGSTYALTLNGNTSWANAWFSDPTGFSNTLMVDGQAIPNGARATYDAKRTCPPLP